VRYISFNSDAVPGNYGTFVSEGDGYALLAAAIFADQKTFNGLYMWVHDIRFSGVERFRDGRTRGTNSNDYGGPYLAAWKDKTFDAPYGSDSHSATDGDVDIAMAMLIAYKQWGEWMMQDGQVVRDSRGNPISLKYEAQRVVGALVDTLGQWDKGSGQLTGMLCGVVGIDGYEKRGNSWGELTRWRFSNEANARYPGVNGPYNGGPNLMSIYGGNYIDYDAPSYFEEFWRWLKNGDGVDDKNRTRSEWEIHQFKRAAASGNWLNKKAYDQGLYASIGRVEMATDGQPTFGVYVDGEDIWDRDYERATLRGRVGMVFQYPEQQLFESTVVKDVQFGPRNQGLEELQVELRAYEALKAVGISEDLLDVSPLALSGGQKRRVAIAGVLAMQPEVLVLDEPTAGLDKAGQASIFALLHKLNEENGITIILI
jgi:energy-coupling factor transporter ATP-binding protein EcfA2